MEVTSRLCDECIREGVTPTLLYSIPGAGNLTIHQCSEIVALALVGVAQDVSKLARWIDNRRVSQVGEASLGDLPIELFKKSLKACFQVLRDHLCSGRSPYQIIKTLPWIVYQFPTWLKPFMFKQGKESDQVVQQVIEDYAAVFCKHIALNPEWIVANRNQDKVFDFLIDLESVIADSRGFSIWCLIEPKTGELVEIASIPRQAWTLTSQHQGKLRMTSPKNRLRVRWETIHRIHSGSPQLSEQARSVLKLTRMVLSHAFERTWFTDLANQANLTSEEKHRWTKKIELTWFGCSLGQLNSKQI